MRDLLRDSQNNSGFFSKALPFLGHLANFFSMLGGAVITYIALRIASSNKSDHQSSLASNAMSIFGTILNSIITFIIYIYSDASKMLIDIGHSIDQVNRRDHEYLAVRDEPTLHQSGYARKVLLLLVAGSISTNVLISATKVYQESILLVDKYLDLFPELSDGEKEKERVLFRWLVVNTVTFLGAYTVLAFQGGFAIKLVNHITEENANEEPLLQDREELYGGNNLLFRRPFDLNTSGAEHQRSRLRCSSI